MPETPELPAIPHEVSVAAVTATTYQALNDAIGRVVDAEDLEGDAIRALFERAAVPLSCDDWLADALRHLPWASCLDAYSVEEVSHALDEEATFEAARGSREPTRATQHGSIISAHSAAIILLGSLIAALSYLRFGELPDPDDPEHRRMVGALMGLRIEDGARYLQRGAGVDRAFAHLAPLYDRDRPESDQLDAHLEHGISALVIAIAAKGVLSDSFLTLGD